jgi:hypothetical protein
MTKAKEVVVPRVDPHKMGRRKGSPNRKTIESLLQIKAKGGEMPIDFLLRHMRNAKNPMEIRVKCAKEAAPYVHPKLSTITHVGDPERPLINAEMPPDMFQAICMKVLEGV